MNPAIEKVRDSYDRTVNAAHHAAHASFLAGALFSGWAAAEASGSILAGVGTGVAVEAIGYAKVCLSSAAHLSRVRNMVVGAQISSEALEVSTRQIVAAIRENGGQGPAEAQAD